jgi:hypothetical protein
MSKTNLFEGSERTEEAFRHRLGRELTREERKYLSLSVGVVPTEEHENPTLRKLRQLRPRTSS